MGSTSIVSDLSLIIAPFIRHIIAISRKIAYLGRTSSITQFFILRPRAMHAYPKKSKTGTVALATMIILTLMSVPDTISGADKSKSGLTDRRFLPLPSELQLQSLSGRDANRLRHEEERQDLPQHLRPEEREERCRAHRSGSRSSGHLSRLGKCRQAHSETQFTRPLRHRR
jgi:hypothetical protein